MIANNLIGMITKVKLNDYGCSLKAYNSEILKEVKLMEKCTDLFQLGWLQKYHLIK